MKQCNECGVAVSTPDTVCPLCGERLTGSGAGRPAYAPVQNSKTYHFAKRLLLFCSVMCVAVCATINLIAGPAFWWWLVVATALVFVCAVVTHSLRAGASGGERVLMQVVAVSLLCIFLDLEFGWTGWSANYVLPAVCGVGIVAILVLIAFNFTNWSQYVFYQLTLALIGFVPLALYLFRVSTLLWPGIVVALLALASLLTLAFFGDRSIKDEFVRRLHL